MTNVSESNVLLDQSVLTFRARFSVLQPWDTNALGVIASLTAFAWASVHLLRRTRRSALRCHRVALPVIALLGIR